MDTLILYTVDDQRFKKDATWAFVPEAKRLAQYLRGVFPGANTVLSPVSTKGRSAEDRRRQVSEEAELSTGGLRALNSVAFLCHGYPDGIQFGYQNGTGAGAETLVKDLVGFNPSLEMITFYCCSVCKDTDNFARDVYRYLAQYSRAKDVQVFGHYNAGHTTKNHCIKIYSRGFAPFIWSKKPVKGYNELVEPENYSGYNKLMKKQNSSFRFAIAFSVRVLKAAGFTNQWIR